MKPAAISGTARKILGALRKHPNGLDIVQIRQLILGSGEVQQHFDRRLRELDPFFEIARVRHGTKTIYKYVKKRRVGEWDYEVIDKTLRAKVLTKAGGRCQMCGRTVAKDNIELHVDHKIPRSWGGQTVEENLWAICGACNDGKKNYFETLYTAPH